MHRYVILFCLLFSACQQSKEVPKLEGAIKVLDLVWSDEFDIDGLPDTTKWSYDIGCLLYTSPSPRDATLSRMPSSA